LPHPAVIAPPPPAASLPGATAAARAIGAKTGSTPTRLALQQTSKNPWLKFVPFWLRGFKPFQQLSCFMAIGTPFDLAECGRPA
jgi:hypothetical protein